MRRRHNTVWTYLSAWGLAALLALPEAALADSASADCSGSVALFDPASTTVCLPNVAVRAGSQLAYYQARLQAVAGSNLSRFALLSATAGTVGTTETGAYTVSDGKLELPTVEVRNGYGVDRYSATLQWQNNNSFALSAIAAVISRDYVPGRTWKPYVGLLPNEKQAVNTLQDARPYAILANAVYDFGTKTVADWDMLENVSKSSGMQAAVYANRLSGQLALVFRGTDELCFIPIVCSNSQIVESGRDSLTDTMLTQGKDSGQFDDAYNYARDMLAKYPGKSFVVAGHSLGGGLAQAVGAAFKLPTYALNSSPVANNYFDEHKVKAKDDSYAQFIHVLADIHDPVSNTTEAGFVYADAAHVAPLLQFDFDNKAVLPTYKTNLDSVRFNKHSIEKLVENMTLVQNIYRAGW